MKFTFWKRFGTLVILGASSVTCTAEDGHTASSNDSMIVEADKRLVVVADAGQENQKPDVAKPEVTKPDVAAPKPSTQASVKPDQDTAFPVQVGKIQCDNLNEFHDAVIQRFEDISGAPEESMKEDTAGRIYEQTCELARRLKRDGGKPEQMQRLRVQAESLLNASSEYAKLKRRANDIFGESDESSTVAYQVLVSQTLKRLYQTKPAVRAEVPQQIQVETAKKDESKKNETTSPIQSRVSVQQK